MGTTLLIAAGAGLCFLVGLGAGMAYHLCFGIAEDDGE